MSGLRFTADREIADGFSCEPLKTGSSLARPLNFHKMDYKDGISSAFTARRTV
jgi:hypothetical protein